MGIAVDSDDTYNADSSLASLASRAALALDNMSRDRAYNRAAIMALAEQGAARLAEGNYDRRTTLAVYGALRGVDREDDSRKVNSDARSLFKRLADLEQHVADKAEISQLRKFCIDLSRSASALQSSPFEYEG